MTVQLQVEMSWWGMNGLALEGESEDALETRFQRIADSGFDGINAFVPAPKEADRWRELLHKHGLGFSVNAYPASLEEMAAFLERALRFPEIAYINAQVMRPFLEGEEALQLLEGITKLSLEAGIPVFVETHRGTITQDLLRTIDYARKLPRLPLTIDFSHYVVAGELHTISEEAERRLQSLLPHAHSIHTRVSNGEQVQVDIGEKGGHPMLPHFARWWEEAMRQRRSNGAPFGGRDTFPVVIELGPPPYAITRDEAGSRSLEISDRWSQSLYLQQLVRRLWTKSAT